MSNVKFKVSGKNLIIGNIIKNFKSSINQAEHTPYGILVSLAWEDELENRNIFLISESGEVIWQIEDIGLKTPIRPYSGFVIQNDGSIEVLNYGYRAKLDMKTGKIHVFEFHFMN